MNKLIILLVVFSSLVQKDENIGEYVTTPINSKYFWSNELETKWRKNKPAIFSDTILDGFYSKKEVVVYQDKKTMEIWYLEGNLFKKVPTLTNGNGYVTPRHNDTLYLEGGLLNGESYLYHYYPNKKSGSSTTPDYKRVLTLENNYLKQERDYYKGVLIAETYFKDFNFINKDHKHYSYPYHIDSSQSLYFTDGNIREIKVWKNNKIVMKTVYNKDGSVKTVYPKKK